METRPEPVRTPGEPPLVQCRPPETGDAMRMHALVDACASLDLNSPYAYLLLCTHFRNTCVVAEREGMLVGFLAGYRPPDACDTLFVWQVAVAGAARGLGLGSRLLDAVLAQPACRDVAYVEASITPSNAASWALFRALARRRDAACHTRPLFTRQDFGALAHEEEQLLRIGPFEPGRDTGRQG